MAILATDTGTVGMPKAEDIHQMCNRSITRPASYLTILVLMFSTSACTPFALTMLGAGATAGVGYSMDGYAYRTLVMPKRKVEKASIRALKDMGINVTRKETRPDGVLEMYGLATDRNVVVRLESLSSHSTQIRTMVRRSNIAILHDKATAVAIINLTEKKLRRG